MLASSMGPENHHYVQNRHGSKTPHDMVKGAFIRPDQFYSGLNVLAQPNHVKTEENAAFLQLWEYDSGSADDFLGKLKIQFYRYVQKHHSKFIKKDMNRDQWQYTMIKEVKPPKSSEDDSIYYVTYSVEKDAGSCHNLSAIEKIIHREWYPHAAHHCR